MEENCITIIKVIFFFFKLEKQVLGNVDEFFDTFYENFENFDVTEEILANVLLFIFLICFGLNLEER